MIGRYRWLPRKYRCVIWLVLALFPVSHGIATAAVQIFVPDPDPGNPAGTLAIEDAPSEPVNTLPVLFVHGHNAGSANDADFNFRKNWVEVPGTPAGRRARPIRLPPSSISRN